jgi:hypothetical protein
MIEEIQTNRLAAAIQRGFARGHAPRTISRMIDAQQIPRLNPALISEIMATAKEHHFSHQTEFTFTDDKNINPA